AAKEFMEHLIELEHAFEEKIRAERERIATTGGISQKAEMLEEMAAIFYGDLRRRMESFFQTDGRGSPAPTGYQA
ncbi:MAG TPA: hypothetical protein VD994_14705, partial [Prosthecobacter sp.]|nr:hypothetical protein [Prosthecobacter sp.]